MIKVLNKRADIQVSKPQMSMLELQTAIQDGYTIDTTKQGGVYRRGNHIYVELVKSYDIYQSLDLEIEVAEPIVTEVAEPDVKHKAQSTTRKKALVKATDEVAEKKDV